MDDKAIAIMIDVLNSRPLKLNQKYPYISGDEQTIFIKNSEDLIYLIESKKSQLKIVLMGEVKAGKSTLLNAIVGEEVSPIGVTETTAVILQISYGKEKRAEIRYKDSSSEIMGIEKMFSILENTKNDLEFYRNISLVDLKYPLTSLQAIRIIDTPGLNTITMSNHETTENFIQKADVVLWVMSASNLGQSDVEMQLIEVAEYGKPIILLVNRIDTIDASVGEVMEYVDDNYGFYIEKSFPVSGYMALKGKQESNTDLVEASGLPKVMEYLNENIEVSPEDIKADSINSSIKQIVRKEIGVTKNIIANIDFSLKTISRREEDIEYYKEKINTSLRKKTTFWLASEFLNNEESEVSSLLNSASKGFFKDDTKEIAKKLKEYTSEKYIASAVRGFWEELLNHYQKEQKRALEVIGEKFYEEETQYKEKYEIEFHSEKGLGVEIFHQTTNEDVVEGAKKGAFVGGAYGVAAAAYAALLGPSAAYITIGAAIGSVLPPVLLVGAVTGAAVKFVNKDKKVKELSAEIDKRFSKIRENVASSLNIEVEDLILRNNLFFDEVLEKLTEIILNTFTHDEVKTHKLELEKYLTLINEVDIKTQTSIRDK